MISRRKFIGSSSLVPAAVAGFPHLAQPAEILHGREGNRPRHIIHLVADGMSAGTLTCADHFSQILRGRGLRWLELYARPEARTGFMNMRSLNSLVTDSSAASSSWGSGSRILNGAVNQLPNGTPLKTLYELFGQTGWKRGLVTTTEITHATPAGFAATVGSRDTGSSIAVQYLERGVEVLLGGGHKFFDSNQRRDKRDLKSDYAKAGYEVMQTAAELRAANSDRPWLGIFATSHLPYTIDHIADPKLVAKVPTLATMTRSALGWLERHDHFILQVEGGRVDHACHNCDAAAALRDMVAFDEAIEVCLAFQKRQPDTLLVITTDHGNGNLGLNGMGTSYGQSSWLFENLTQVRSSFSEISKLFKRKTADEAAAEEAKVEDGKDDDEEEKKEEKKKETIASPKEIIEIVRHATGYKLSEKRAENFALFLEKKGSAAYELMNNDMVQLGQLLGNHLGIGWTGNAHTADYVPILALGPGAEHFRGFIQNVDVFRHYTQLAGIDYRNPTERLIARGPEAGEVEPWDKDARV